MHLRTLEPGPFKDTDRSGLMRERRGRELYRLRPTTEFNLCCAPEPVFVSLLRSPGIDSQPGWPVRQPYLTFRPVGYMGWRNPGLLKRLQILVLVFAAYLPVRPLPPLGIRYPRPLPVHARPQILVRTIGVSLISIRLRYKHEHWARFVGL